MNFAHHQAKLVRMSYETLIEAAELRHRLQSAPAEGWAIIDCRFDLGQPTAGWLQYVAGHIPGARYADLNEDLAAPVTEDSGRHPLPAPQKFAATLARLGIGSDVQVVAYDAANGAFAARLWWMVRAWGHRAVAVLDGGYPAWIAAGGETVAGAPAPLSGQRVAPPPFEAWPVATAADVAALIRDPRRVLVDARAPERYAGSVEPIDAVAGHVPGAENHPFASNLGGDGRFLGAAELRRRWRARLGDREPAALVAMCGSGVTACHNLLALEIAGLPGAKLYAGSWSEWIRDPRRPIAKGGAPLDA
jgi:thiosulfate/3-mercaptopyruvate sulfurtransferase